MNKSNKELILEIIIMALFVIIIVPVCVNASASYNKRKATLECNNRIAVNIKINGNNKMIQLTNLNKKESKVNLILKITKYSNEYAVKIEDKYLELKTMTHTEDDKYFYYNIGSYEISKYKELPFSLVLLENKVEEEYITYSFMTEEENC